MATYPEHLAALRGEMLRKRLWVVITKAVAPREELDKVLEAHLIHQAWKKRGVADYAVSH